MRKQTDYIPAEVFKVMNEGIINRLVGLVLTNLWYSIKLCKHNYCSIAQIKNIQMSYHVSNDNIRLIFWGTKWKKESALIKESSSASDAVKKKDNKVIDINKILSNVITYWLHYINKIT